jgi:hypothetical protein
MKLGAFLVAVLSLGLAGCASYHITPISSKELREWDKGELDEGFVFYQSELYFLVTPSSGSDKTNAVAAGDDQAGKAAADKALGLTVTPICLPNPAKAYRVTTFNFLAKSDFAFNFKDGWQLSSIADKADNTTIANSIAGELKTLLSASGVPGILPTKTPTDSFLLHPKYDASGIINGFDVVPLRKPASDH